MTADPGDLCAAGELPCPPPMMRCTVVPVFPDTGGPAATLETLPTLAEVRARHVRPGVAADTPRRQPAADAGAGEGHPPDV